MGSSRVRRSAVAAAILAAGLLTAACAGGGGSSPAAPNAGEAAPEEVVELLEEALAGPDGKDERVFGASDDVVIQAIEATFSGDNAKAEWDGQVLKVTMDGSATAATATLPCLALEAFLKDGEEAVIVYPDGQTRCADR